VGKQLAVAGLLLLAFTSPDMARAQLMYPPAPMYPPAAPMYPPAPMADAALPPYEVMSIVRSTGLTPMTRPMRRGPYYVLVAVDRFGRQLRVVVDAQLGDVVNLRPAFAASYGPNGPDPGPAMPPGAGRPNPDNALASPPRQPAARALGDIGPTPLPPHSMSEAHISEAHAPSVASPVAPPARLSVTEPASPPPLPRPRPKLAANAAPAEPTAPVAKPPGGPADDDKIE
jgi:hypothetical protein